MSNIDGSGQVAAPAMPAGEDYREGSLFSRSYTERLKLAVDEVSQISDSLFTRLAAGVSRGRQAGRIWLPGLWHLPFRRESNS